MADAYCFSERGLLKVGLEQEALACLHVKPREQKGGALCNSHSRLAQPADAPAQHTGLLPKHPDLSRLLIEHYVFNFFYI